MSDFERRMPPLPGRKPVEYDATGRMIRSWQNETAGSKDFLTHYDQGSGRTLRYKPSEMDQSPMYKRAMQDNKKRFEESMIRPSAKFHPFYSQILSLKDGETKILNNPKTEGVGDYWDRDIGRYEGLLLADPRQSLGTGSVKIRSNGTFQVTRKGDTIAIDGKVDHALNDVYDFNKQDFHFSPFRSRTKRGSKPFEIEGSKREKVKGLLKFENNRITEHDFTWEPVD